MKKIDAYRCLPVEDRKYEDSAKRFGDAIRSFDESDIFARIIRTSLEICTKCGACVNECPIYLASGKEIIYNPVFRTNLIRRVIKNSSHQNARLRFRRGSSVSGEDVKAIAENVYRCTLCRRCAEFCTFKVDNALINRQMRVLLAEKFGIAPRELAEDGAQKQLTTGTATGMTKEAFLGILRFMEDDVRERKGKTIRFPVDRKGADMLVMHNAGDYLSFMGDVTGIAEVLDAVGADWTLNSGFNDVVNYGLFFSDDYLRKIMKRHLEVAENLGVKTLVVGECGHAYKTLKIFARLLYPKGRVPFEIKSILQVTDEYLRRGELHLNPEKNPEPVTFHDSCNLARMGGLYEEPRRILRASCKDFREMQPNRELNYCCGGGAGFALMTGRSFLDFRMKIAGKMKIDQVKATEARKVVSACSNCKAQLRELLQYYGLDRQGVTHSGVHELVANALVD
ncbi:MAG: (Fe-S)-binding protein [Candidatus Bathyarchaeia archaeon]